MRERRAGVGTVLWALGLIAMMGIGTYSAYFAYSTRLEGGASNSGFEVTLTHSTHHVVVPHGSVVVVIPYGIDGTNGPTFQPLNVKVVMGVNNTVLFDNQDSKEHIVESIKWPAATLGFSVWVLQNQVGKVQLNVTGVYVYNFELLPTADNGTITVVSG